MRAEREMTGGHTVEAPTFDLLSIRRARIVCVYLLRSSVLVQGHESVQEVVTRGIVVVAARVVGKIVRLMEEIY